MAVETETLGLAAMALERYTDTVSGEIQKMKDAAIDCSDNMGSDEYSSKAITKLAECIVGLSNSTAEAEELKLKILKRKKELEDS